VQTKLAGAPSPPSGTIATGGGAGHGYDRYVISGAIGGGAAQRNGRGAVPIIDGRATGVSISQPQGSPVASSPPPQLPSSGAVTAGGSAGHSFDRYLISSTLGGGWHWQRHSHAAGNQSPARANGQGAGANGRQFVGSLNAFTSRVHTWWKSRNAVWMAKRDRGNPGHQAGNESTRDGVRRGK